VIQTAQIDARGRIYLNREIAQRIGWTNETSPTFHVNATGEIVLSVKAKTKVTENSDDE